MGFGGGGGWCSNVDLVIGFGPSLDPSTWTKCQADQQKQKTKTQTTKTTTTTTKAFMGCDTLEINLGTSIFRSATSNSNSKGHTLCLSVIKKQTWNIS